MHLEHVVPDMNLLKQIGLIQFTYDRKISQKYLSFLPSLSRKKNKSKNKSENKSTPTLQIL